MKQRKTVDRNTSLPDMLNAFYAWFEQNASSAVMLALTAPDTSVHSATTRDISSAFNTIIPSRLISKLYLGLGSTLCNWILSFLTHRLQTVKVGNCTFYHDYVAKFRMNAIYTLADDTTVVGQVSNNDESKYRREIDSLVTWKFGMPIRTLINFYRYTIESKLSRYITAWYGNCSAQDCKKLQKVV
eukprot:g37834.t1